MRTREEIEASVTESNQHDRHTNKLSAILELLLDIRDLLNKPQ